MQYYKSPSVKILLIDDEESIRENIQELLEIKDYEVQSAKHATDALNKLISFNPDLIVTDLMLPDFSGIELIEQIRRIDGFSEIPAIVITGNHKPEILRSSMTSGADDYLSKPFKANELYESITSQLYKKAVRKENVELIAELSKQSPLPIIRINQFGKLIYSNPAAKLIKSENLVELLYKKIKRFNEVHFNFEFPFDKQLFKVEVTHNSIQGYYNVYFLDITTEWNKNLELSQKNQLIQLKNENLMQFANIVSHDLKAPIINLRQLTNLIISEAEDVKYKNSISESLIPFLDQSLEKLECVMAKLVEILKGRHDGVANKLKIRDLRLHVEKQTKKHLNGFLNANCYLTFSIGKNINLDFPLTSFNVIIKNICEILLKFKNKNEDLKIHFSYSETENRIMLDIEHNCCLLNKTDSNETFNLIYKSKSGNNIENIIGFQTIKNIMNSHNGDFLFHKKTEKNSLCT